jgi:hypothetical protein
MVLNPPGVIVMQNVVGSQPIGSMPGPSRRITVEPIRLPTHAPPAIPSQPRRVPEHERPPAREPVPAR